MGNLKGRRPYQEGHRPAQGVSTPAPVAHQPGSGVPQKPAANKLGDNPDRSDLDKADLNKADEAET